MPAMIYEVDPFGIFREDFSQQVVEPNQRFVKMKWLSEEKREFDSFIFGSSKVGNIDSRRLQGGNYYNMTYSMGLPYEWMQDAKQLYANGYEIENIIICLDDDHFLPSLVRSFIRSFFLRAFFHSWILSFILSFFNSLFHSFLHSFIHSFMHSLIRSFFCSFIRSFSAVQVTSEGIPRYLDTVEVITEREQRGGRCAKEKRGMRRRRTNR